MKTAGILLLFGLCAAIGLRLAAKKCEGVAAVRALARELSAFWEAFDGGEGSLAAIAAGGQGMFFVQLNAYLAALSGGMAERDAAALAAKAFPASLQNSALLFFGGLSDCTREELRARTVRLREALSKESRDAEPKLKQAKLIRAVGVLIGAALAVWLV